MSSYSCNSNICDFFRLTNPTLKPMYNMPILIWNTMHPTTPEMQDQDTGDGIHEVS